MLGLGTGISHTKEEHILWRSSCYNHMLPFWNSSGGITCTRRHRWTYGDGWQKRGECQQTLGIHSAQFALALADSTNWPPMPFFMYCHQQKNDGHWPEQLQRQIIHQNAQIFHRNWLIPSPPAISIQNLKNVMKITWLHKFFGLFLSAMELALALLKIEIFLPSFLHWDKILTKTIILTNKSIPFIFK